MKYEPVAKDRDEKMLDVHDLEIDVDPDESMMSDNSYGFVIVLRSFLKCLHWKYQR